MGHKLAVVACVFALGGCGGDGGNPAALEPIDRIGTYNLVTVEGKPLPYPFPNAPGYELTGESLTLNADMTFSVRSDQRFTDDLGQVHTGLTTSAGTYTITSLTLTLNHTSGHVVVQTFTGADELTAHCCFNTTWIYRR